MLKHKFLAAEKVVELEVKNDLSCADFQSLGEFITQEVSHGRAARGLIVEVNEFPEWRGIDALACHVEFIRDHHQLLPKIAVLTDDVTLKLVLEKVLVPLIKSELKIFAANGIRQAEDWLNSGYKCTLDGHCS